jgi:hypothetical protein
MAPSVRLERGLDPERVVESHQLRAEFPASGYLHIIVRYSGTAQTSLWPEPDERDADQLVE